MISIDGQMIGKPRDEQHALAILKSLDGRVHSVRTGVCLLDARGKEELFSVETQLEFGKNGEGLLQQYVATGEPMCAESNYLVNFLNIKGAVPAHMPSRARVPFLSRPSMAAIQTWLDCQCTNWCRN